MKGFRLPEPWGMYLMKWGPVLVIGAALFIGTYSALTDPSGPVLRYWTRYVSWLERKLRLMFIFEMGKKIGYGQIAALGLFGVAYTMIDIPVPGLVFIAILGGLIVGFGGPLAGVAFILGVIAVIAVLGYRQVDLSLKVLGVLVAAEFLIVLLLDLAIVI